VPVCTMRDLMESEHLQARDFFVRFAHPMAGTPWYPVAPARFAHSFGFRLRRSVSTTGNLRWLPELDKFGDMIDKFERLFIYNLNVCLFIYEHVFI
jgi:hypothetical protein